MTERLFDKDSYINEFDATVLSCEKTGEEYRILLDKTCFFYSGGGQNCDKGVLNDIEVVSVSKENGNIYHYTHSPIITGSTVHGKIHWYERFFKMQNHTAEHIISGIVHKQYGFDNCGFHLGEDYMTMDYNGILDNDDIEEIEKSANKAVYDNLPVSAYYPKDLQSISYRSKLELGENVRIVEIAGIDTCACCAPHVKSTAEVGLIKIISCQKFKKGVRILAKCGDFALREMDMYQRTLKKLSSLLSLPPEETCSGVEKLITKAEDLRFENNGLYKKIIENNLSDSPYMFIEKEDLLNLCVNLLFEKHNCTVGAFCGDDNNGYRFNIITNDEKATSKRLKEELNAVCGGRNSLIQGLIKKDRNSIISFFNK